MTQPVYNTGAVGYDEFFGQVTRLYIPALLEAGRLREGQTVLDVATGTGIAAEAALAVVGPSGSVIGGDVSLNMLDVARKRLANLPVRLEQFDAHDSAVCRWIVRRCDLPAWTNVLRRSPTCASRIPPRTSVGEVEQQ